MTPVMALAGWQAMEDPTPAPEHRPRLLGLRLLGLRLLGLRLLGLRLLGLRLAGLRLLGLLLPRRGVLGIGRDKKDDEAPGVSGRVRLDRRTKRLTKRLRPGEIAIIDHVDLDRVSAEALVSCQAGAVVNVAPSISGRYPNLGPHILIDAGIPLIDDVGPEIFAKITEGDVVRIEDGVIYRDDDVVTKGIVQSAESIEAAMIEAKAGLSLQLEAFVANTMEYLKRERDLLLEGVGVPDIQTRLEGRHALIVVRGYHYREDLATLRPYLREYRPVLIGVDGGADALLEAGYRPDMIVGDMDSVSDEAPTETGGPPGSAASTSSARRLSSSLPRPPARTSRCCSPTTRAPRSSSPWGRITTWWNSSTRAVPGWPAPS
jgi:thiamine pyrophosphokinase-like protein